MNNLKLIRIKSKYYNATRLISSQNEKCWLFSFPTLSHWQSKFFHFYVFALPLSILNFAKHNFIQSSYSRLHSSHSSRHTELQAGRSPSAQHTGPSGINPWPAAQRTERDARTPRFLAPNSSPTECCLTGSFWNNTNERANFHISRSSTLPYHSRVLVCFILNKSMVHVFKTIHIVSLLFLLHSGSRGVLERHVTWHVFGQQEETEDMQTPHRKAAGSGNCTHNLPALRLWQFWPLHHCIAHCGHSKFEIYIYFPVQQSHSNCSCKVFNFWGCFDLKDHRCSVSHPFEKGVSHSSFCTIQRGPWLMATEETITE